MVITYVLAFILAADPYPVFAFMGDFDSLDDCSKSIDLVTDDEEILSRLGCIAIARESI